MAVRDALIIEDAYLDSEDATSLDDVFAYVTGECVDLTTHRGNVLRLEFADLEAINRKVEEQRRQLNPNGVSLGTALANCRCQLIVGWQPDWSKIGSHIRYITKNAAGDIYGHRTKPYRALDGWHGDNAELFPRDFIPSHIPWQLCLFERPSVTCNINITNAAPVVEEVLKERLQPKTPDSYNSLAFLGLTWDRVPDEHDFVAADKNGQVWSYITLPVLQENRYWWSDERLLLSCCDKDFGDWTDSLRVRPSRLEEILGVNWDDVPKTHHYIAADNDGYVYAYSTYKPSAGSIAWWSCSLAVKGCFYVGQIELPPNLSWRNTLLVRPGYTEPAGN